jgi:excisionase family DNA binding protein
MTGCLVRIPDVDTNERLLTVKELARYLGVPVATLYRWRYQREGPAGFRVGRHVRYRWRVVEAWIERRLSDRIV